MTFSLKETIIFKSPVNNHRIKHQERWFSAPYFEEFDYLLPLNKQEESNKLLTKLSIPMSLYPDIRTPLKTKSDISAESLYNSINKMCEDINKTFAPL